MEDHLRACFAYISEIIPDRLKRRAPAGDAKLHVDRRVLEDAFRRHRQAGTVSNDVDDSHLLLLVYAVECGLKRILLGRRGYHTTARLEEDDLTHDLDGLLKDMGSPHRFGTITLSEPQRHNISVGRLHEALRYGVRLTSQARQNVLQVMRNVLGWIEENIE